MIIRPDYYTLDKLLQGRLFRIPDYQRAYSWETRQRNDLFEDIRKLSKHQDKERHHFMSTVVCLKRAEKEEVGTDEFGVFDVVDGQQRLTTLVILLKTIAQKLSQTDVDEKVEADKLNELLVKRGTTLILLQLNHDTSHIFRKYLREGIMPSLSSIQTLAGKNMIKAFKECKDFVENWEDGALSLLKLLKNRLGFIFYVLEDEGSVYTVFEVLNSRGLAVDWLDKCKNMLMGIGFERLSGENREETLIELQKSWSNIYQAIGISKVIGEETLRFAATLKADKRSKIMSAEQAMEFFRKLCTKTPQEVLNVSSWLWDVADKLKSLDKNPRLKAVTDISQARLLALSILLAESLGEENQRKALDHWEKVTFRIYGLFRKDSRSKVGDYVRLARRIQKDDTSLTIGQIIGHIDSIGQDYPVEDAIKEMRENDCYNGWEEELRYFFFRYEEHLAGETISEETWEKVWATSPSKSIEHIFPQTPTAPEWQGKFGVDDDEIEKQTHQLGNLILLPPGVNSQAGNKPFVEKKKIYHQNHSLKLMDKILELDDWDSSKAKERQERLLQWAEQTWG